MTPSETLILVNQWVMGFFQKPIIEKFSQNRGQIFEFGKCMGPVLGQHLVNVWVSFHFPSGTSLPKKFLSTPREFMVYY